MKHCSISGCHRHTNRVGAQVCGDAVVALQVQIRVVPLSLSHLPNPLEQLQTSLEISHLPLLPEGEGPICILNQLPAWDLCA